MQEDANRRPTQGWLSLDCESDLGVYNLTAETSTQNMEMMERIVAPSNAREAYRRVKRNGGCPGVDEMTVEELQEYLHTHWQQIRKELLDGAYKPSPGKRHELPKPGGGTRVLGIPTVPDRLIQQAVLQVSSRPMATQPQPSAGLCAQHSLFRRTGTTFAPCERVTETPWYVIRMPGVVGGESP